MIDLRKLEYLEAIYKYKTFSNASKILMVSQPAISSAISLLEEECGQQLLIRGPKGVEFTEAGETFMPYVIRTLRVAREADTAIKDIASHGNPALNFGFSPTVDNALLHKLYEYLRPEIHNKKIHINENTVKEQLELMSDGLLDFTYNGIPDYLEREVYEVEPVTQIEIGAVMHPSHPLAKEKAISIEMLKDSELSLLEMETIITTQAIKAFEKVGIEPQIITTHNQIISMLSAIGFCENVGFVNIDRDGKSLGCDGLVLKKLKDPIYLTAGFIYKKGKILSPYAERIMSFIVDYHKDNPLKLI